MVKEPKPARGMPRSLIYMLIPGGFLLLVLVLVLSGVFADPEPEVETVPVIPEAATE
ncbi:hypothetical protein [Paracoccus rhizosphaerae]|uniref:Uncharacterized protein n=1 Tax=Paracoccus rhizosphaerae TaxID=1133347 RepID=A0ABV6CLA7_9RHOB|nr:hypothetical protein [Paracoccus rhizosphaerae]